MFRNETAKLMARAMGKETQINQKKTAPTHEYISSEPSRQVGKSVETTVECLFGQIVMPDTWLSELPVLYTSSIDASAIKYAIQAAALFWQGNQNKDAFANHAASNLYSKSLRRVSAAINNPDERLKDQMICSILTLHLTSVCLQNQCFIQSFLQLTQDIIGDRSSTSAAHLKACQTLLLQRQRYGDPLSCNSALTVSLIIQSVSRIFHLTYSVSKALFSSLMS